VGGVGGELLVAVNSDCDEDTPLHLSPVLLYRVAGQGHARRVDALREDVVLVRAVGVDKHHVREADEAQR